MKGMANVSFAIEFPLLSVPSEEEAAKILRNKIRRLLETEGIKIEYLTIRDVIVLEAS